MRKGMWEEWKGLPWLSMEKGTVPVLFATEFWDLVCGRHTEAANKIVISCVTRFWSVKVSIDNNGHIKL